MTQYAAVIALLGVVIYGFSARQESAASDEISAPERVYTDFLSAAKPAAQQIEELTAEQWRLVEQAEPDERETVFTEQARILDNKLRPITDEYWPAIKRYFNKKRIADIESLVDEERSLEISRLLSAVPKVGYSLQLLRLDQNGVVLGIDVDPYEEESAGEKKMTKESGKVPMQLEDGEWKMVGQGSWSVSVE